MYMRTHTVTFFSDLGKEEKEEEEEEEEEQEEESNMLMHNYYIMTLTPNIRSTGTEPA